jgi:hypothetical protein
MASQKVPSTALWYFFRHSAYYVYSLVPEKILRLVYEPFCLAIYSLIRDFLRDHQDYAQEISADQDKNYFYFRF